MPASTLTPWRRPLVEAMLVSAFILVLFYYWFGIADRYAVFLYGHTATGIPAAQPFDPLTTSRYWMAGLVAAGWVMVVHTTAYWLWGRLAVWRGRTPVTAPWWQVWGICAVLLSAGIPMITMTVNAPTLPPALAAACGAATLAGLAVALAPGPWAATRPWDLIWLAGDGAGLMPALLLLRAVELPSRGLSVSPAVAWFVGAGGCLAGWVWLAGMSGLRRWRHKETPGAAALLMAGMGLSYTLLPLAHHLFATPPEFRYISAASNFFAFNPVLQAVAVLVATVTAAVVVKSRRWVERRRQVPLGDPAR